MNQIRYSNGNMLMNICRCWMITIFHMECWQETMMLTNCRMITMNTINGSVLTDSAANPIMVIPTKTIADIMI